MVAVMDNSCFQRIPVFKWVVDKPAIEIENTEVGLNLQKETMNCLVCIEFEMPNRNSNIKCDR